MIEDNIEVNVNNTIEVIDVFPQITEEVVDINLLDNREDVLINVTESIIEVNINKVTNILSAVWGSITGTLSDQTDLQSALNAKQDDITLTVIGSSGASTLVGSTLNIPTYSLAGLGGVSGSGTTNYLPKFTGSTSIGNSLIYDNGTNVGIGLTSPAFKLDVEGNIAARSGINYTRLDSNQIAAFSSGTPTTLYINYSGGNTLLNSTSGSVGIGTTVANGKLTVLEATTSFEVNTSSTLSSILSYDRTGGVYKQLQFRGSEFIFSPSDVEKMRLTNSGNLGIGTTSPSTKTHFLGGGITTSIANAYNTVTSRFDTANPAVSFGIGYVAADIPMLQSFNSVSNVALNLTINPFGGNVGIGTTTSYNSAKLSINGEGISIWRIRTIAGGELPLAIGSQSVTNETIGLAGMYHVEYGTGGFGQSGGLIFKTSANDSAPTERMRIHGQSGNLGIGTTSPQSLLHVNGVITFGGDTRYGVSKIYDANTGDGFGLEQVSAAQSGLAGAGTRLFTANGGSNFISLGKYTTATAFTSWLHITQAGNIGIGTTASVRRLEVASDGSNWISGTFSGSGGTDKVVIGNLGNTATIGGHTSALTAWSPIAISGSPILFQISGTEKMRLDASGNLGIGTTSPAQKLHVVGGIRGEYYSSVNNKGLNQIVDFIDLDNYRYQLTFEDGILVDYVVT